MAAARSAMLLSGAAFAGMASVAGLFRAVGLMDEEKVAPEVFWAVLFGMLVVGVMLLVFAPPSRQTERRVELGPPQAVSHSTRPKVAGSNGKSSKGARSSGVRSASSSTPRRSAPKATNDAHGGSSPDRTPPAATASPGGNGNGHRTPGPLPGPDALSADKPPARSDGSPPPLGASRHHPNDPAKSDGPMQEPDREPARDQEAAPPSLRGRASTSDEDRNPVHQGQEHAQQEPRDPPQGGRLQQQMERSQPASAPPMENDGPLLDGNGRSKGSTVAEVDHRVRYQRRREELETRLESLDQRLNQAKVSMGLGRISHAGYRQYVKEVERERTLIESELMTLRDVV